MRLDSFAAAAAAAAAAAVAGAATGWTIDRCTDKCPLGRRTISTVSNVVTGLRQSVFRAVPVYRRENDLQANGWEKLLLPITNPNPTP